VPSRYGEFSHESDAIYQLKNNFLRIRRAIELHENIKLIPEREAGKDSKELEEYQMKIKNSSKITIIGFGFDRNNIKIIGLPTNKDKWAGFLDKKILHYHNYNGKMKNINREFEALRQVGRKIVHSDSDKIIDAYHYDFKLSIF
jgi:hypothetical protein